MKRFVVVVLGWSALLMVGCEINTPEISKAADALDRFSAQIEKTTDPESGNLKQLVDQTSRDLRGLIQEAGEEAKKTGKAITEDALIKFALEREKTFAEILRLTKKIFGDTRILTRELQGVGLSVPLQLDDALKEFRPGLKKDLAEVFASVRYLYPKTGTPIEYDGVVWSFRPTGFQTVWFAIPDADSLQLKIGDSLIAPDLNLPKSGGVTFRIPIDDAASALFDDTQDKLLGFQLVDVLKKKEKEEITFRYGGFMRLTPRFPLTYDFKIFPEGGKPGGEQRPIDSGPALMSIVSAAQGKEVLLAKRHGDIYRVAKSRLAVGTSFVEIPQGSHWELTVAFPDGKLEVLSPDKRRRDNSFGSVTVHGPNRKGDVWSLMVDVELKK